VILKTLANKGLLGIHPGYPIALMGLAHKSFNAERTTTKYWYLLCWKPHSVPIDVPSHPRQGAHPFNPINTLCFNMSSLTKCSSSILRVALWTLETGNGLQHEEVWCQILAQCYMVHIP
jgi:hypothetical protein